jgi:hypothetical protein
VTDGARKQFDGPGSGNPVEVRYRRTRLG